MRRTWSSRPGLDARPLLCEGHPNATRGTCPCVEHVSKTWDRPILGPGR
jgi:hypothetical protein